MARVELNVKAPDFIPPQSTSHSAKKTRFVHYGHSMSDIPENKELLDLIETLL